MFFLRGNISVDDDYDWQQHLATASSRMLKGSTPTTTGPLYVVSGVLVSLIIVCYFVCPPLALRLWLMCHPAPDPPDTLVMSGHVIRLTPGQRRAVLEAIFSETSKEVTEKDVAKSKKKKSKKRRKSLETVGDQVPTDVEILTDAAASSCSSSENASDGDIDLGATTMKQETEILARSSALDENKLTEMESSVQPASIAHDDLTSTQVAVEARGTHSSPTEGQPFASSSCQPQLETAAATMGSTSSLPIRSLRTKDSEPPLVPDLHGGADHNEEHCRGGVEETKEEEQVVEKRKSKTPSMISLLSEPITFSRVDSVASAYTEIDDETEDNDCPICLNSYREGDTLIASKHCTHLFHKDCILDWLLKHDSCPVCRVDMVTVGDMTEHCRTIVGVVPIIPPPHPHHRYIYRTPPPSPHY